MFFSLYGKTPICSCTSIIKSFSTLSFVEMFSYAKLTLRFQKHKCRFLHLFIVVRMSQCLRCASFLILFSFCIREIKTSWKTSSASALFFKLAKAIL